MAAAALNSHHPLGAVWVVWVGRPCFDGRYAQSRFAVNPSVGLRTIRDFWGAVNNMTPPSRIETSSSSIESIGLFRQGITPDWEDARNRNGCTVTFRAQFAPADLDRAWMLTLLDTVGGTMPSHPLVNGVRIVHRHVHQRIEVWLCTCDVAAIQAIAQWVCAKTMAVLQDLHHDAAAVWFWTCHHDGRNHDGGKIALLPPAAAAAATTATPAPTTTPAVTAASAAGRRRTSLLRG